jgi:hypothetical protein
LPSFKSRRTLSLLENESRERKSNPEKNRSSNRVRRGFINIYLPAPEGPGFCAGYQFGTCFLIPG